MTTLLKTLFHPHHSLEKCRGDRHGMSTNNSHYVPLEKRRGNRHGMSTNNSCYLPQDYRMYYQIVIILIYFVAGKYSLFTTTKLTTTYLQL